MSASTGAPRAVAALQRAVRLCLAAVMGVFTLALFAVAPMTALFSVPPALVTLGLAVWLCQPPETQPRAEATHLVGWGASLTALELAVAVAVAVLG